MASTSHDASFHMKMPSTRYWQPLHACQHQPEALKDLFIMT